MKFISYKFLFWIILIIAILEGVWIYFSNNLANRIGMSPYSFNDSVDGLVTAEGSWISSIQLAFPLSSVKIECWKDFGYCWIADGTIMDNDYLSVGLDLKEISEWTNDYVQTKPSKPLMGCVEESYRLDRRSKVVTYATTEYLRGLLFERNNKKADRSIWRYRHYSGTDELLPRRLPLKKLLVWLLLRN